jgi:hypothetical protein
VAQNLAGADDSAASLVILHLQPRKGPFLVGTHEPAITGDVRGENGGQLAFDAST